MKGLFDTPSQRGLDPQVEKADITVNVYKSNRFYECKAKEHDFNYQVKFVERKHLGGIKVNTFSLLEIEMLPFYSKKKTEPRACACWVSSTLTVSPAVKVHTEEAGSFESRL